MTRDAKPVYRTVRFRLSEQEYQELRQLSALQGIRSFSALTRFALNSMRRAQRLASQHPREDVFERVTHIVDELDRAVQGLSQLLASHQAAAATDEAQHSSRSSEL